MQICWHIDEVVDAIAKMPSASPLPLRTVLISNPLLSRQLQRALLSAGRSDLLAGTRFLAPGLLAETTLLRAGLVVRPGEEELREHRLAKLIADGLELPGFSRALLTETVGWPAAFATTILELERADLRPSDLDENEPVLHGVRIAWEAVEHAAGPSWTRARMIAEASRCIEADASLMRRDDQVLAVLAPDAAPIAVKFAQAIPSSTVLMLGARPRHRAQAVPPRLGTSDLAVAAAYLFENDTDIEIDTRVCAGPTPDGTLSLEEHDGVAAEIDAAVDWVARRVLDGTALDRIAVLFPVPDPWCSLVTSGLRVLAFDDSEFVVEVPEGLPLMHDAAGARVRVVLQALREHLNVDALASVLCFVRAWGDGAQKPSRTRVLDLVYSLGTRGGSVANAGRALEWRERLARAKERLAAPVDTIAFADQAEHVARRHELRLATLEKLGPAIVALCDLAEDADRGIPLNDLTTRLATFIEQHLLQPGDGPRVHAILEQRTKLLCEDTSCREIRGAAALELLDAVLRSARVVPEPSCEPRMGGIYVGTVASAAGLSFDAVRVIGMCEGSIPPTVRGDPVLPDEVRARISPRLATGKDRVVDALAHFDLVVRSTRRCLAISAPRLAVDRTLREPSSIFIDVGAALRRADDATAPAPTMDDLRRTDVRPALAAAERERLSQPCRPADWLDRLAAGHSEVPPPWRDVAGHDLFRLRSDVPAEGDWHAMDGVFESVEHVDDAAPLPGLTAELPISAWMLRTLVQCPHRFLYEHVLRWHEPATPPLGHDLDAASFGDLVHAVAERFFRTHGLAFARQDGVFLEWRAIARTMADEELANVLESHGLDSEDATSALGRKLRTHVDRLVEHAWSRGPRRFVATERAFGFDTPLRVDTPSGPLFVRGRIDLIDADDTETRVHDLKTGRCTRRSGAYADPSPVIDIQIGLYTAVLTQLADELGLPRAVAGGFIHTDDQRGAERSFVGQDAERLRASAVEWLACAHELLAARLFPRTPVHEDCKWCAFKSVCGEAARPRSDALLAQEENPALVRFRILKAGAR